MSLPVSDWQFWVTTALAFIAALALLRSLGVWKLVSKRPRTTTTKVSITVKGQTPKRQTPTH